MDDSIMNRMRFLFVPFCIFFIVLVQGCASKDLLKLRDEASLSYFNKDYSSAIAKLEILTREVPMDADLWFRLGNAYAKSDKPQKAVSAYQKALLNDPEMGKAWYNMGLIQTRTALKTFIDMELYSKDDDPVGMSGEQMRLGLMKLLQQEDDKKLQ
ncbi:tetratricopeptide repeat protein [Desulfomarina sp.]